MFAPDTRSVSYARSGVVDAASAACTKCGRTNRAEAAFCDACGTPLRSPVADSVRARATAGGGEVFVGRERELAALGTALDQALAGEGRIVMLAGEPGIGKTRTAQMLARYAEPHDMRVLWGRCYEEPGAPPFWPWLQVIAACAESYDDARSADARQLGRGRSRRDPAGPGASPARPRAGAAPRRRDAGAVPPVRRDHRLLEARRRGRAATSSSSTICTGPTHRRCACSSSSRRPSAACGSSCSGPTATSSCRAATRCRTRSASSRATRGSSACASRA